MNDYESRPDGEYFVDVQQKPIPPQNTWHDLSAQELLEVRSTLQGRLFDFRRSPQIVSILKKSLSDLESLISERLSSR